MSQSTATVETSGPHHGVRIHPTCSAFPLMGSAELRCLADDIKANGLLNPIVFDGRTGQLVDGRNRLRALCLLGSDAPDYSTTTINFPNQQAVASYLTSSNVMRRQLSKGQKSIVAARLIKAGLLLGSPGISNRDAVGKRLNISGRLIQQAMVVITYGCDELIQLVERQVVSVFNAEQLSRNYSSALQRDVIKNPRRELGQWLKDCASRIYELRNLRTGDKVGYLDRRVTVFGRMVKIKESGMVEVKTDKGDVRLYRLDQLTRTYEPPPRPEGSKPLTSPSQTTGTTHNPPEQRQPYTPPRPFDVVTMNSVKVLLLDLALKQCDNPTDTTITDTITNLRLIYGIKTP